MLKILAIIHAENERMGFIEDFLEEKEIEYEYLRYYRGENIKRWDFTHLIIMGGPMGAYEEKKYPFLEEEKRVILRAFKRNIPILGICLGAQLIARSLGSRVYPHIREIGWFKIWKNERDEIAEEIPEEFYTFQWHNDTFEIPNNAKMIFTGDPVKNQGFRIGNAIALQFHPEVTREMIKDWISDEECLTEDEKKRILKDTEKYIKESQKICRRLMNNFLKI
jgi:GMP synthase-like glutamine amidotransferase